MGKRLISEFALAIVASTAPASAPFSVAGQR
jgi:hypothetical protein